jgi:hypothetical protein
METNGLVGVTDLVSHTMTLRMSLVQLRSSLISSTLRISTKC